MGCAIPDQGSLVRHVALLPSSSTLGGISRVGESSVAGVMRSAKTGTVAAEKLTTIFKNYQFIKKNSDIPDL